MSDINQFSERYANIRRIAAVNLHSPARRLLADLHAYPDQNQQVRELTERVTQFFKILDEGLSDEDRILSSKRRGGYGH